MVTNNNPIIVEAKKEVFPKKESPFTVSVQLRIQDEGFEEKLKSLDSSLYYYEKNIVSSLLSGKKYHFEFNDIVSISNTNVASPKRTFNYVELSHGIHVDFAGEKDADSFLAEIKEFIADHVHKEYQVYQELVQKAGRE